MNKIKFIARAFAIGIVSLTFPPNFAYANDVREAAVEVLEERFDMMDGAFDYRLTPEVKKQIQAYTSKYRQSSEMLLGRTTVYFPLFEKVITEKDLPQELKYISIIESSLKPYAKSRVGAAGLWQFMKATGRMMGLKINRVVDERNDPIKSTDAAMNYLSYLYEMFDDWTLAIAAYNCGPGNVKKAIRRGNSTDFWVIRKYLPKETRAYVPKFMAASYLMTYYLEHGLTPSQDNLESNPTTTRIYKKIDFKSIARYVDMDVKSIWQLNPMYIKGYIPESEEGSYLTLPEDKLYDFAIQHETELDIVYQPLITIIEEVIEEEIPEVEFSRDIIYLPIIETKDIVAVAPSNQTDDERRIWEWYSRFDPRQEDLLDKVSSQPQEKDYDSSYQHILDNADSYKELQNYFFRL